MYFLNISSDSISNQEDRWEDVFSPFVPNTPFLYTLKASENRKVFWCSQGVDKGCIGHKWVNPIIFSSSTGRVYFM